MWNTFGFVHIKATVAAMETDIQNIVINVFFESYIYILWKNCLSHPSNSSNHFVENGQTIVLILEIWKIVNLCHEIISRNFYPARAAQSG